LEPAAQLIEVHIYTEGTMDPKQNQTEGEMRKVLLGCCLTAMVAVPVIAQGGSTPQAPPTDPLATYLKGAPVLPSQKGSLFLTRPILFHYIARREELEASANELFNVVASGKVRINVNQRFALKDAADAHKALEARATSGSTILTI